VAVSTIKVERVLYKHSNTNGLNAVAFGFTAAHDGFCTIGINASGTSGKTSVQDTTLNEFVWASGYYTDFGTYGMFPIFKGHSYAVSYFEGVNSFRRILYYYTE
jgi:hypothetical protein